MRHKKKPTQKRKLFRIPQRFNLKYLKIKIPDRLLENEHLKQIEIKDWHETLKEQGTKAETIDISGGGVSFLSAQSMKIKQDLYLEFEFNAKFYQIIGQITHCTPLAQKENSATHKHGVQFIGLTEKEQDSIIESVFKLQNQRV